MELYSSLTGNRRSKENNKIRKRASIFLADKKEKE